MAMTDSKNVVSRLNCEWISNKIDKELKARLLLFLVVHKHKHIPFEVHHFLDPHAWHLSIPTGFSNVQVLQLQISSTSIFCVLSSFWSTGSPFDCFAGTALVVVAVAPLLPFRREVNAEPTKPCSISRTSS
jgi:hypothetical protein